MTRVHADIEGDTLFPEIESANWKVTSSEDHKADEKNEFDYSFIVMDRAP